MIRDYKPMSERRMPLAPGVTYQTSFTLLEKIPTIIQQIITKLASARFHRALYKEYGEFALVFEIVNFVLSPEYNLYMDTQEKIKLERFQRFRLERIEFAYPTERLLLLQRQQKEIIKIICSTVFESLVYYGECYAKSN